MHSPTNVSSAKNPYLHSHWAVHGVVCQTYARILWLRRNLWNFVPRCMPQICEVFGSQYSYVKLEGPLHIPGIYQSVLGLGSAGIRLVYVVVSGILLLCEVFFKIGTSILIY